MTIFLITNICVWWRCVGIYVHKLHRNEPL